jgi:type I restriction enzyme M protein
MKLLKNCLNILKTNENIIEKQALIHISYLLILKLLEPYINKEIIIDDFIINSKNIDIEKVEKLKNLMYYNNLINDNDIINNINDLYEYILSKHSITKNIFIYKFNIKNKSTYKELFNELNLVILNDIDYDLLGNIYENIFEYSFNEYKSINGQFFTPPIIKNMMIDLIDPNIYDNGCIDTCCDPTMGTGGLLISYLKYILNKAKSKNIKPNWNFIINDGIYGKEIDLDTHNLSLSNFLISFGYLFKSLSYGNSIYKPILKKFDNIIANPPYGIKNIKYDDIDDNLKNIYYPIKTNDSVSLFIQSIIYMLNKNGKCAIVLPIGINLYSKTDKKLINIREYLMKTCDLKEIIYLPSGIFTYTLIKTCIFYFIKKKDYVDISNIIHHETKSVKFYNYMLLDNTKKLIIDVPIDKIANNFYSLNYTDYEINDDNKENNIIDIVDNIFHIKNYKNSDIKYEKNYIVFNNKLLILKNNNMIQYLNYISFIFNILSNNKINYNLKDLKKLKIIIPTCTDNQNLIINYIKDIENINIINNNKINDLKKLNDKCIELCFINNIYNNIDDVCFVKNGKRIKKENLKIGEYPVIGGGKSPMGYHNEYNINENTVLCSITGTYSGYISIYDKKVWMSECFALIPKNINVLNNIYLYYILKNLQHKIYKLQKGTAHPHIYYSDLKYLKIPIPTINRQLELIEYINTNINNIKNIEYEIQSNNIEIINYIKTIIS